MANRPIYFHSKTVHYFFSSYRWIVFGAIECYENSARRRRRRRRRRKRERERKQVHTSMSIASGSILRLSSVFRFLPQWITKCFNPLITRCLAALLLVLPLDLWPKFNRSLIQIYGIAESEKCHRISTCTSCKRQTFCKTRAPNTWRDI